MPKVLREVSDFVALPVTLKPTGQLKPAKHYIYIKAHEPQVADEDATRSLFLVNIPVSTTEAHLRHLFANQLSAGRVKRVDFSSSVLPSAKPGNAALIASSRSQKKRKRLTADELESGLEGYSLPATVPGQTHCGGSTAIVVFVDRAAMELSLKAARRAVKSQSTEIVWGAGIPEAKLPSTGLQRYDAHKTLRYPPRRDLLQAVENFMTAYTELEETRSRENAKKRQMPDEDGFITVTRGTKGGVLKKGEADELRQQKKAKDSQGLEDFYRFQMREKRKEQQGELLRKFEEDKRKVVEMRTRRAGRLRPET